jgi:hypothetical protein
MSDEIENKISEVTRRAIVDHFTVGRTHWAGRYGDSEFLARLYDLAALPSHDRRFRNAKGDIHQHAEMNSDWPTDWVFYDDRFRLLYTADSEFLRFLCETVHPVVRPDEGQVAELVCVYNEVLAADGWQLVEGKPISGRATFVAQPTGRVAVFDEPTGWEKVDRQVASVIRQLGLAGTAEEWQTVGLLCREALISVAQEIYDPAKHPTADVEKVSATDAKRMLEAIFAVELRGSTNDQARAHARAAVDLALALQHKRTPNFRTAALCAEGTCSVVNMLAILAGRRSPRGVLTG